MAAPLLKSLAESLGSPEPAVRLILSLVIGYPFALVYRWFLFYQSPTVLHLFHTLSGLALAVFNFGSQVYHSAVCILVQFLMLRLMGRTVTSVLSSFVFQMVYLLAGYYYTATEEYDIKWTMPHCVLTLKLIESAAEGCSPDVGALPAGGSWLLLLTTGASCVLPAMKRFAVGFLFLVIYAIFSPYYPDSYFLTDEFEAQPFWYRCVFMLLWAKFNLYKYVTCWLIAEGVCILSGLGYNGVAEGKHQWDACANMKVWLFETTPRFQGTIDSFNINTNEWAGRNVFKRCRFLGNKALSHILTLLFLTVWHGLHSGYLICFSMEFLIITVEKRFASLVNDSPTLTRLANSSLYPLIYVVQQFLHWFFMAYSLVPFCLLTYDKWLKVEMFIFPVFQVQMSVYFLGHVFFIVAFLSVPYLRKMFVPKKER
ncbi:unnamed protein product, partial [Tetraodon nigroviridis]